jgi:hypothetical protein
MQSRPLGQHTPEPALQPWFAASAFVPQIIVVETIVPEASASGTQAGVEPEQPELLVQAVTHANAEVDASHHWPEGQQQAGVLSAAYEECSVAQEAV